MFRISVVCLNKLMIGSVVLDGSDQFKVLQHGGRNNIVESNVFGKEHHAVLEKATSDDFVVHLSQKDHFKLSVYAVLY